MTVSSDNYFDFIGEFRLKIGATFRHIITLYDDLTAAEISAIENNKVTAAIQTAIDAKKSDISNYTSGVMQVRDEEGTLVLELSTDDGTMTIDNAESTITFEMNADDTTSLTAGEYRYDALLIASATERNRVLQGQFHIDGRITIPS